LACSPPKGKPEPEGSGRVWGYNGVTHGDEVKLRRLVEAGLPSVSSSPTPTTK
jgi:hypothetical protein